MNFELTDLFQNDLRAFEKNHSVLRLVKNGHGFVGQTHSIYFQDGLLSLRVNPRLRIKLPVGREFRLIGEALLSPDYRIFEAGQRLEETNQPFIYEGLMKVRSDSIPESAIILEGKAGMIVLSRRPSDIEDMYKFLQSIAGSTASVTSLKTLAC